MLAELENFFTSVLPSRMDWCLIGLASSIWGALEFAFGTALRLPLYWLCVFVTVDYILGNWKAARAGEWCSRAAYRGAVKKFFIFFTVAMCHGLDICCGTNFLESGAIIAFAFSETGSLIENIDDLGYGSAIPHSIRKSLKVIQEKQQQKAERKADTK